MTAVALLSLSGRPRLGRVVSYDAERGLGLVAEDGSPAGRSYRFHCTAIADGSSMLGQTALKNGLIDKIGSIYDVEDYLKGKIGEDAALCQ